MKLHYLSCASLLLAMMGSLASCKSGSGKFENYDLIPVRTSADSKWSMVNSKGEIVYDGEFKNQPSVSYNGLFAVEGEEGYTVFSSADSKSPKEVKGLSNLKSVGVLEDGLLPVTFKRSRITIVDKNGEKKFELAPVKGSEIVSCAPGYVDGLLLFKTEEKKYGYYGKDAKIAIEPQYDMAAEFSEEMAIVGTLKADNDGYTYSVINKSGKQVFGIQDGYEIVSSSFRGGHIILSKDDRFYLADIKGEMTKLPEKISSIVDYNSKYIIFKSEGDCGVMDLNGEEIIRPKYNALLFDTEDSFFAQKEYTDKNCVRLDSKGEETGKIDFSAIMNLGKFGYLAKDGKTFLLLDDKFKKKGKEEFYEVNIDPFIVEGVVSDYFDMSGVASTLVGMIDDNKAAGMQFGESAAKLLAKETPSASYMKNEYDVDSATKIGSGYRIVANAYFTEDLVDYDYMGWEWNTSSKLASVQIAMKADSDWGEDGAKALKDAFVRAGFKVLKSNKLKAVYKKGNLVVLAESGPDNCVLGVGDTSIPGLEGLEQYLLSEVGEDAPSEKVELDVTDDTIVYTDYPVEE